MIINQSPSAEQLRDLQDVLDHDEGAGISDIWGLLVSGFLGAEVDGRLVGVASVIYGENEAELFKLYVAPPYRRSGVGLALVEATLEQLRVRNLQELNIEVAGNGRNFWRRVAAGYKCNSYGDSKFSIIVGSQSAT